MKKMHEPKSGTTVTADDAQVDLLLEAGYEMGPAPEKSDEDVLEEPKKTPEPQKTPPKKTTTKPAIKKKITK